MSFLKNFLVTFALYVVFNFIFMLLFVVVGGIPNVDVGTFFGTYASGDWAGLISVIFQPGGRFGTFNLSLLDFGYGLFGYDSYGANIPTGANVMGFLWVVMPGLLAALIGGYKFSEGEIKTAYFGTMLAIFLATIVPLIMGVAGLLDPLLPGTYIVRSGIIAPMYLGTVDFLQIISVGLINGAIFGGTSALIANSNY